MTLGETIVRELNLERGVDTLGRWMAHYLAETMLRAETPGPRQDEDKALCSALILKIWTHRSSWPRGWPPPGVAELLGHLFPSAAPTRPRDVHVSQEQGPVPPWTHGLKSLQEIHSREVSLWRNAALSEVDFEEEKEWLEHSADLEADEARTLERILRQIQFLREDRAFVGGQLVPQFALKNPSERAQIIAAALERVAVDREALLARTLREVETLSSAE